VTDPATGITRRTRLLLFLYSRRNLVGSLLALVGLGAHFVGILEAGWLAIVVGLYGIGYLAAPAQRELALSLSGELAAGDIEGRLDQLVASLAHKVEPDVLERVSQIRQSIVTLLPRLLAQENVGDASLFTVRQTALEYLPTTLQSYVALPAAFRRMHAVQGGKTPKDLLLEQLGILDAKMKEIVVSVAQNDMQALLVNGRFLQEKFGQRGFLLGKRSEAAST